MATTRGGRNARPQRLCRCHKVTGTQFADARDATFQGLRHGDTYHWDIVGTITRANRTLVETTTMPESGFTITQGTLTVLERGVAVPYSGMLEALSKFSVREPIMKALKADANRDLDVLCNAQFDATQLHYVATTGTVGTLYSNGTATGTNSVAFATTHWKDIVDKMRERNIPYYTPNEYIAIGWPTTFRPVKNSLETLHQYTETGLQLIFNGEIGMYERTRAVEQTNVVKGVGLTGANAYTDTSSAWTNSLSDWIYFFGEDTVTEALAVPEEVRAKIPCNDEYYLAAA